jgi:hypothetical protein
MDTITIPVICDRCRAEGAAGHDPFTAIADLLTFDPVQRRSHVNNWTAEHQRAFVAALAITGSPRQAARAIGRHAFGADQIKMAKGGRGFADACQAALELYREREMLRIKEGLSGLAEQAEERDGLAQTHLRALPPPFPSPFAGESQSDGDDGEEEEHEQAVARIRRKLLACRRLYLVEISADPAKRAAWETLVGPVDWANGDLADPPTINMREPGMILAAATGMTDAVFGTEEEKQAAFERIEDNAERLRRHREEADEEDEEEEE